MNQDAVDMFAEMDEIFNHLFARMNRFGMDGGSAFMSIESPDNGIWEESEPADIKEIAEIPENRIDEPVPEIVRDGQILRIVLALPGITEENLNLAQRKDELIVDAVTDNRHFHSSIPLPSDITTTAMEHSLKNGVLEVTLS